MSTRSLCAYPVLIGVAVLLYAASVYAAGDSAREAPSDDATPENSAALDPITIEGEGEPTLDQLQRKFGDALPKPKSGITERRLNDGTLEVNTRFGRFCQRPMPAYLGSGLGGDVNLLAPCAA